MNLSAHLVRLIGCSGALIALVLGACSKTLPAHPEVPEIRQAIVEWNQLILSVAEAEDGFWTLKGLRTATTTHIAIHDALNAIEPRFDTYLDHNGEEMANPLLAINAAALFIAGGQYPDRRDAFVNLAQQLDAKASEQTQRDRSQRLGQQIAAAVLDSRAGDGWDRAPEYQWHPMAPGVYAEFNEHSGTPDGFIFGSGLALMKPFALESADQLRSPPPPEIDSSAYREAFDEVRDWGRAQSALRTADQTHLALWWKDFVENSHNRLARKLARSEQLDGHSTARLFALLNISIFDAYASSFNNKFHYNHWRPYTAIRWAANDGNADTVAEPDWTNTHNHTYPFPSYPSAHGTACAAAMSVFSDTFGDRFELTMETQQVDASGPSSPKKTMHPNTRRFDSFSRAGEECAASRVYLGIHFRYDSAEGNRLGRAVGALVIERAFGH